MKNPDLQIRDATLEEMDGVAQIIKAAYQEYEKYFPGNWEAFLKDIMDVRSRLDDAELIVAEKEKRLVGTVTLFLKKGSSSREDWPPDWAGIRLLAVHPAYRGHGIGRALMDECIRRCREQDVKTIGLHTTKYMEIGRRMYEKMGFKRAPEFDFYPAPNATVMAYRLDL